MHPQDTRHIELYGTPSTTYLHILNVLEKITERAGIPLEIVEVNAVSEILQAGIRTVPAVRFNGREHAFDGHLQDLNKWLKSIVADILRSYRYGQLPLFMQLTGSTNDAAAFHYAYELAIATRGVVELVHPLSRHRGKPLNEYREQINEEWMGSIFQKPIVSEYSIHQNWQKNLPQLLQPGRESFMIVSRDQLQDTLEIARQLQPEQQCQLLIVPDGYHFRPWKQILIHSYQETQRSGSTLFSELVDHFLPIITRKSKLTPSPLTIQRFFELSEGSLRLQDFDLVVYEVSRPVSLNELDTLKYFMQRSTVPVLFSFQNAR